MFVSARLPLARICLSVVVAGSLGVPPSLAAPLNTESKEVKDAIARGLAFLEKAAANDKRPGAQAVAGLAFIKNNAPATHPVVRNALKVIDEGLKDKAPSADFNGSEQIYNLGLAAIFVANLDEPTYRANLDPLMQRLLAAQKSHGGWGYPSLNTGDTSMTQYGVLAMWEASRRGIASPAANWEKACNWLLRTQDPSGAFGYQGADPGSFSRTAQTEVRHSMAAAGLGSLYVCREQFDVPSNASTESDRPSALKPVKQAGEAKRVKTRPAGVDMGRLKESSHLGDAWMTKNYTMKPEGHYYYFLYGYERYQSFKEQADKKVIPDPQWYSDYANEVLKQQQEDGRWEKECRAVPDTGFAILFLCRSAQKSIQAALGAGLLVGGRGLPNDTGSVQLRAGVVVAKPLSGPADKMLSIIEDPSNGDFEGALEGLSTSLEKDQALLPELLVRLKKLAKADTPAARAAAIKAISRSRNLDNAPLLIFALDDEDWDVVKEARDGLRFLSRKFEKIGPVIPCDEPERRAAIQAWKDWYLSLRPDYKFDF